MVAALKGTTPGTAAGPAWKIPGSELAPDWGSSGPHTLFHRAQQTGRAAKGADPLVEYRHGRQGLDLSVASRRPCR